jgi:PPOX class probable F420-dependent enzyme
MRGKQMSEAIIPEAFMDLLQRPIVVTLVTLMPDYHPQASLVWFSYDGTHIWVNSAKGRQKDKNMRERPQVTVLSVDPDNNYRFLEVRGLVEEITEEGAVEHIHRLSKLYFNRDDFFNGNEERRAREQRVIYKIRPVRVIPH